jgi:tetratricopeptide (TPR) repeat protein
MLLRRVALALLFLCGVAGGLVAQDAPFLNVLPAKEQARDLELRADLQMIRKNYWQAVDLYQQALKYSPDHPVLLNKIGIAYHQLARLKDAKKYYQRATKVDKEYAQAWNNLGAVNYGQKKYKDAIKYYRRALQYSPAQATIHGNLGVALFARKKNEEALQEFRLALLLNPNILQERSVFGILMQDFTVEDRARFHFLLARSFASIGNADQALLYLRHCMEEGILPEEVQAEPIFLPLSEDKRFQALFEKPPQPLEP